MSQINATKVSADVFAAADATETYNIYELAAILKTTAAGVRKLVVAGTVPQPLFAGRAARQWTKAMLTTAGITAVTP